MKYFAVFAALFMVLAIFSVGSEAICPCPRMMDPVCGSDDKTYNNRCLLNCEAKSARGRSLGLRIARMGRCD